MRMVLTDESMLTLLRKHREIVGILNRRYARELTRRNPRLTTKYLRHYLASGFDKKTRRDILAYHYRYLDGRVIDGFSDVIREEPLLWWHESEVPYCSIRLAFNSHDHHEGDLSLVFFMDETYLYEMSFSIVPGSVVGAASEAALLIARLQGAKDHFDTIKSVTKACGDNAPATLLATVAFRLAAILQVDVVAGVSNAQQLWNDEKGVIFDYDVFWEKFGARRNARGFYELAIPYAQKPLDQISQSHRRRTRIKREFKARAAYVAGENFQDKYLKPELRVHGAEPWPSQPGETAPPLADAGRA